MTEPLHAVADRGPAPDESTLWKQWREAGDAAAREALVKHYLWLARAAAFETWRQQHGGVDVEVQELIQAASVGLLESVDRFDPARGVPFAAFAKKRLRGSLLDCLERHSERRAQLALMRRQRQSRLQTLTQPSSADPFAELVDVAVGLAVGMLLEDSAMFVDETRDASGPYHEAELSILREQFQQIVTRLPGRHRDVICYHYYYEMSFVEIGSLLRLGPSRISQLHAEALKLLRARHSDPGLFNELA